MTKPFASLLILITSLMAAPATAGVNGFSILNQTGVGLSGVALRRVGSSEWVPVPAAPGAGTIAAISFKDPDCAFDLRASVDGAGPTVWRGVNLCDVKRVTLNRDKSGRTWVDYD
jgi:hypothetical protein